MMYDWIVENGMDPVIVATKKDKLKKSQIPKALKVIREGLDVRKGTRMVAFSAETKEGREEIWSIIGSFLPAPEEAGE
jgi:GTP-binding protein